MSPWWSKSSSKEAKKKSNGGGIIGFIRRKLKSPSESKQTSLHLRDEVRASTPSNPVAQSQNFAERWPDAHPLPLPENSPDMGRVEEGNRESRNRRSSEGLSPLFHFPLPRYNQAQNGHDQTDVEGYLATDSVFTDSDSDSDSFDPANFRFLSPQASNYETGDKTSTNGPSRHLTYATQKKREKLKAVKACVSSQTVQKSPKWHPLSRDMANLQIPQPDSSMSSPSKSPMRVFEPEPALTGFSARRPYADTGFPGPGPFSSPESGQSSSYNLVGGETAAQLFWQRNRYTPEHTPIPSPRMTSPGPSSRIQSGPVSPLHPWAGGSNMDSSANWPGDAVNAKQQTHRLPLPPLAMSNTGPSTHWYTIRTTPVISKSPGRADILASHGSGWKKGRLLGRGTFGHVYLGFNSERGEMCAMKEVTLFSDDSRSKESAQQLRQEIALLSRLRHPNIVQYYGSETMDDKICVYLEYVAGGSIFKLLQEYGKFGEVAIKSYTRQILSGLVYLHSTNTVHRDIKGANILVDPKGRVKLADFGVAKHISGPSCSLSFKGSAHWMAPEIINNDSSGCNLVGDIWSLGCTIVEMATTKPPWSEYEGVAALFKVGNTEVTPEIPDHLSGDAKDFIFQCFQWAPARRPSAAQLLDHPFVKDIASSETLMPDPGPNTKAMRSRGIGHASEGVPVPHSRSQNMNRRLTTSPTSSPRVILPTPLTGAAAGGAVPFYHQAEKPYSPDFMGLTSTSRSPTRSFAPASNALHVLNPECDMFRAMPQGSPFQEIIPPDNDFVGNQKKRRAGKSVLT
ncbi:putative mitogen-activated protein kinase kinase kinase STE-STE11 family [Helianthus annuus]|nr:putative mitogen-activated protein kinase kinase kinase STE-STE11 family [Helianthus annuus]KAJ0634546.1 putative mitogen-activated protein kinase kinase kinase STE-STE11 family [Helianthus annuus]